MSNIFNVTYMDGTKMAVRPSLFDTMQAEKHIMATDGHNVEQEPLFGSAYATYAALRRNGQLTAGQSFDEWAQNVDSIEITQTTAAAVPGTASPMPDTMPAEPDLNVPEMAAPDPLQPLGQTAPSAV